jgi:UDP-glucose 4-epimerase
MLDFKGKTLLIPGGTGSFGEAVVSRFGESDLAEIRIFSRDEKKQHDMRLRLGNSRIKFHIGDVRDLDAVRQAMEGVDLVFHAAALKQVPSCEFHPMEAVRTNILGTDNVLQAAHEVRVGKVVVLSTDKAAYPINAMGMSKAMMERVMVARSRLAARHGAVLCGTRYGNVMASRGSVIPLFLEQIMGGRELTVTDPAMTRFMMTLEDAVELVLFAFEHGRPGDLFVQKAPAATIEILTKALQGLAGTNLPVRLIGTRHGEKLYETLLTREERAKAEDLGEYFRVPADNRDLNYSLYFSEGHGALSAIEDYNSHNTRRLDEEGMKEMLWRLPIVREALESGRRVP